MYYFDTIHSGGCNEAALKVVSYSIIIFADKTQSLPIFFEGPCKCCGIEDHSLLRMTNGHTHTRVDYICPLVVIGDEAADAQTQLAQNYLKYKACPKKMAMLYVDNPTLLEVALLEYETNGEGIYMSERSLTQFKQEVRKEHAQIRTRKDQEHFTSDGNGSLLSWKEIHHRGGLEEFEEDLSWEAHTPIFCDLDGVLVDFEEGIRKIFGKEPNELPRKHMWGVVAKTPNFYTTLPWMKDGKQLWESIKGLNPIILTAAPRGSWAERQKRQWVTRELGEHVPMIVSTRKYEHCPPSIPPAILIDDRTNNCKEWTDSGGIAIMHKNATDTVIALQQFGLLTNKATTVLSSPHASS